MAEKLDGVVRKDEPEFQSAGCPQCQHKPFRRRCLACGYEKETLAIANEAAGEMKEIRIGKKVIASDKYDLWQQLCSYARANSKLEKQAGRAWHLYQDIVGERPSQDWVFDFTQDAPITAGTMSKIKSLRIAFIKGRAKAA